MYKKQGFLLFCLVFALSLISLAQPKPVLADKIVGVVGNKIVLKSDIDNSMLDMQRQGMEIPANGKCMVLEQALGVKALVLQAEKDSLPITDEDIESELDNRIRYFMQQYGSKDELERIAGKSIYQIKDDMRDGIRDLKMAQAMRDKIVSDVRITPTEVKAYFEKIPADSLPYYETEVEVGQIVVLPKATREAEEYAVEQLKDYKRQIEAGKDFRSLAALYSEDPGSKDAGGQYEVNRTAGLMDPVWIAKAFALKEGQVSNPFKTQFGYHIVQMVSRSGDDAVVRHILKIPQVTQYEMKEGFDKLDTVRSNLIAGTLDFGTAVNKYSDDPNAKFTAGRLQGPGGSFITMDQLDPTMLPIIKELKVGGYSQPVAFTNEQGRKGIRLVYLISQTAPHRENLKDDYSKIANRALEEKKETALEEWFYKKIKTYYIMVDKDYETCPEMTKWTEAAKGSSNTASK